MNSFCGGGSGVGSVFRDVWCLLEFEAQPEAAWVVRTDVGKMAAFCCKTCPEKGKWAATTGLSGGGCGMVDVGGTLVYPPVGWGGCWSSFSGEGAPPLAMGTSLSLCFSGEWAPPFLLAFQLVLSTAWLLSSYSLFTFFFHQRAPLLKVSSTRYL